MEFLTVLYEFDSSTTSSFASCRDCFCASSCFVSASKAPVPFSVSANFSLNFDIVPSIVSTRLFALSIMSGTFCIPLDASSIADFRVCIACCVLVAKSSSDLAMSFRAFVILDDKASVSTPTRVKLSQSLSSED